MGPKAASAAVEIDPRLLRQLEEEYESLKSTSSGARRRHHPAIPPRRPANLKPRTSQLTN